MAERVHAVNDFYGDPIDGIADFEGRPHHFQRKFDDAKDDYSVTWGEGDVVAKQPVQPE